MASSLFCLEVYVHKVEKLAKRLRSSPPALAVRFLDYAPVIVEPGSEGVGASRDGSAWYGSGKRCVFECEEVALGKKLKARSESALLVHAIEAGIDRKRRKQFGSATVALAGFADGACGNEPLGAVRTWGRVECRVLVADAYGRTVLRRSRRGMLRARARVSVLGLELLLGAAAKHAQEARHGLRGHIDFLVVSVLVFLDSDAFFEASSSVPRVLLFLLVVNFDLLLDDLVVDLVLLLLRQRRRHRGCLGGRERQPDDAGGQSNLLTCRRKHPSNVLRWPRSSRG